MLNFPRFCRLNRINEDTLWIKTDVNIGLILFLIFQNVVIALQDKLRVQLWCFILSTAGLARSVSKFGLVTFGWELMAISRTWTAHLQAGLGILFSNRCQVLINLVSFFDFLSWLVLNMLPFGIAASIKVLYIIQVIFVISLSKNFIIWVCFYALRKFELREKFLLGLTTAYFWLNQLNFCLFQFSGRNCVTIS